MFGLLHFQGCQPFHHCVCKYILICKINIEYESDQCRLNSYPDAG